MTKTAAEWAIAMLEDVVLDVLRAEHWHRRNISEIAREAGLVCPTVPVRWQDGITREILYRLEAKGLVIGGGWWGQRQITKRKQAAEDYPPGGAG